MSFYHGNTIEQQACENMKNIISKEQIRNALENKKLKIIGEIKTSNDKILCETTDNYYVMALPSSIIRRNDNPPIFSKYNPYTIRNIKTWIKNNNIQSLDLVSDEYLSSSVKMTWVCRKCKNEFNASWNDVLQGKRYCNKCAKINRYDTVNYTDYNFLVEEKCKQLNYELLPNQNIVRSNTRFKYICNKHRSYGVQVSYPNNFITDYGNGGCYQCGVEKRSLAKRKSISYLKKITNSSGMIYEGVEYSENDKTKILYRCPNHYDKGIFKTHITNMKRNSGKCPCCIGRFRTKDDLQNELNSNDMNVSILEYANYSSPIKVQCDICGNVWMTSGINLSQGHRCPKCSKSKFELSVENTLQSLNIDYISQYWFDDCRDKNPLPFDFYLPSKNTLIEADGEGHYKSIRRSKDMSDVDALNQLKYVQYHDKIKTDYCKRNGLKLIRIPYWERENLTNFIKAELTKITEI